MGKAADGIRGFLFEIWWDDRNLAKIAVNDVSLEEVECIVCDPLRVDRSRSSGLPIAIGFADDGRFMACVYEPMDELVVRPVTAFCLEPK